MVSFRNSPTQVHLKTSKNHFQAPSSPRIMLVFLICLHFTLSSCTPLPPAHPEPFRGHTTPPHSNGNRAHNASVIFHRDVQIASARAATALAPLQLSFASPPDMHVSQAQHEAYYALQRQVGMHCVVCGVAVLSIRNPIKVLGLQKLFLKCISYRV